MMDAYDVIRTFLARELNHQRAEVESMRRDLAAATDVHRSIPDRMPASTLDLKSGQLHDAQAVAAYLSRLTAAFPERNRGVAVVS